ncbi:hypothetical protein ACFQ3Z_02790 [Streptomyces nogalater]
MLEHYSAQDDAASPNTGITRPVRTDTPPTDAAFTEGWMRRFAASVRATEAELTALDQRVGDGDFGTNLRSGLDASVRALDQAGAVTPAAGGRAAGRCGRWRPSSWTGSEAPAARCSGCC